MLSSDRFTQTSQYSYSCPTQWASSSDLLASSTSSCTRSSSVRHSTFWLECRFSSLDTDFRCMDFRDLALVVDDGSTQLARIFLFRTIRSGFDQQVTTFLRRDAVVEFLWHWRSRRGGCCTRCIILATPHRASPFLLGILSVWTVVLLRSVRFWQKGCSSCIGSNSVRHSHPSSSVFPVVSRFITGVFSFVRPFRAGIQCRCCQFQLLDGQTLRRSTKIFCSVRNCHMWYGRLRMRQN